MKLQERLFSRTPVEGYLGLLQTFEKEEFTASVNGLKPLNINAKPSILDVCRGPRDASDLCAAVVVVLPYLLQNQINL